MAEAADTEIEVSLDDAAQQASVNLTQADRAAATAQPKLELTPPEPPKEPPAKKPPKIVTTDEGLEKLKAQLAAEAKEKEAAQARAAAAEARAAEAAAQAATAQGRAQDSELTAVTTGLAHVKQMRESLRNQFAAASAAGDHLKMAEIQDEMAEAAANQKMFERAEQELKNRPKPQPVMPNDPVEELAAKMAPQSAAWIRAHREYATGAKYKEMVAAHEMAVARQLQPNTPEYFQFIERKLDLESPSSSRSGPLGESTVNIDTTPQQAVGGRQSAPAAAPVSRGGTGNGSRPRSMTLTPDMREAARMAGMTDQEYAKYRQELIDEGKLH